ncbi:hypothetical protein [Aquimarina sp. RZ0]|uniref:hypothetical protein n=1 Tax=Aquimarina sp. RZ0 TaxID=2607730 RepID=UPI0011F0D3D0|nr:hypothetical protein [Aquimarina sp. RZ0]KAA1245276.1 hypothetical protein F0000_12905 [Aquimarina sp. RZ0]
MKNQLLYLFISLLSMSIFSQSKYSIIYEADANGKLISGNINDLKTVVQNGNPIRVGWVLKLQNEKGEIKELEHWTDTKFLTIIDDNIYAQIHSIYQQMTDFNNPEGALKFLDNQPDGWVAIISTSGIMRQKYADILKWTEGMSKEEISEMVKEMETSRVRTKWATIE